MAERKIIYELHPVKPERKAELRAQGYTIIDARFDPASATQNAPVHAPQELTRTDVARMKKRDLQSTLRANGLSDLGAVDVMRERLAEHLF